jgi:Fe-S-cluster-containing dehydrogenase component
LLDLPPLTMNPGAPIDPEFAEGASDPSALSRKEFLRVMGASLALAGSGACTRQPPEKIVPYVRQPEVLTPGEAQWYATAMELGPNSYGLLVKSHEGRPTKIEGNPGHPMSLGRTGVHAQAALLDLYDPDRSQVVRHHGKPSTWEDFLAALQNEQAKWKANKGEGLALLTGRSTSPLLPRQIAEFMGQYRSAQHFRHDAAYPTWPMHYDIGAADVIVSFDADFLGAPAGSPRDTADFARRRQPGAKRQQLYVLESMPSLTGAMADYRFAVAPDALEEIAWHLSQRLATAGAAGPRNELAVPLEETLQQLWRALREHPRRSLVLAGDHQPGSVHQWTTKMNMLLRNSIGARPDFVFGRYGLKTLIERIASGIVTSLIVLDTNPVYSIPGRIEFPRLPARSFSLHVGAYFDETAAICEWHVPLAHWLESWSDTLSRDNTYSVVQPLMEPLYQSKTLHEIMATLLGSSASSFEIIKHGWPVDEPEWKRTLHDGYRVWDGAIPDSVTGFNTLYTWSPPGNHRLDVLIRPDPHLLDGRFANNPWLQELPKPFTRLTWGNAIHISPRTAADFHVAHGDEVELVSGHRSIRGPIFILPGHADRCATIHLGGGRTRAGRVGNGVGFDASPLQTFASPWLCRDVEVRLTGRKHDFATAQHQRDMAGRHPVRVVKAGDAPAEIAAESLYPAVKYTSPSWGMVIDLNTCTGCGTCTIACQAENNIPVVGRAEVLRGRAMHWIRVDQYIEGGEQPQFLHQPVPCMHCENAPCEVVCPVAATVHDHQGLNVMVYNRCIGTRYCSNNCPYKVRRFNFFQYSDLKSPQLRLQRNPDVTVRERGVMEKCTYCVQRITAARITADVENRTIRDGEVVPACAQACPANAIVFGDILDPSSKVSAARRDPRHYALLEELNTRPRTTYLARVAYSEGTK